MGNTSRDLSFGAKPVKEKPFKEQNWEAFKGRHF